MEAARKQAVADAKSIPTSFWARRRDDAKGELEAARSKAAAARQEARNPTEKMAIIHQKLKRLRGAKERAFDRVEVAYHEIRAAIERQQEAREQYKNASAKIEALQAESDAMREAHKADEAQGGPTSKPLHEQMRLDVVPVEMRAILANPHLDNTVRGQLEAK